MGGRVGLRDAHVVGRGCCILRDSLTVRSGSGVSKVVVVYERLTALLRECRHSRHSRWCK